MKENQDTTQSSNTENKFQRELEALPQNRKEFILNRLNEIAVEDSSNWLKKAEWRERNEWWLKHWKWIQLKWYRFLRKINLR